MRSSIASGLRPTFAGFCVSIALAALAAAPAFGQRTPALQATPPPALIPDTTAAPAPTAVVEGASSDPRMPGIAADQARRLIREGKPDVALQVLDAALAAVPRDPQLRFLRGVVLADLGRAQEASAVFEKLAEDFPELPEPHNNLAVMYAAAGELDKARVALENAVRALPDYALAHENLGDIYLRMAGRSYERATQLDPRSASARERLTLAREFFERVAPAQPKKP